MTFRIHITVLLILSIIRPIQAQTTMDTSTIYIHQETASLKSRAVQAMLAMVKAKKILERKMTAKKINQEAASLPRRLQKNIL